MSLYHEIIIIKKSLRTAHIFLQICLYDAAALCWVKSYVDSSTLQSVMQTVTQSQQGQDKKGSPGTWGKKKRGGRRTHGLRDSKRKREKVQSQMETND